MTSKDIASEAMDFLESYRAAFERFDTAAVADHFAYPSYIASDADDIAILPIASRQDCFDTIEEVMEMHRRLGTPSGLICDLSVAEFSPRLIQASLRMQVSDGAGRALYDFKGIYTLAKTGVLADSRYRSQSNSSSCRLSRAWVQLPLRVASEAPPQTDRASPDCVRHRKFDAFACSSATQSRLARLRLMPARAAWLV